MKKIFRNLLVLSTAGVLSACGSVKWVESDFAGVKTKLADAETKQSEALFTKKAQLKTSYEEITKENINGTVTMDNVDREVFAFDLKNNVMYAELYERTYLVDLENPENNKNDTKSAKTWYTYNSKKGIIIQVDVDGKKEYSVYPNIMIENDAKAVDKTVGEYVNQMFYDFMISALGDHDVCLGLFKYIASGSDVYDFIGAVSKSAYVNEKYYVAEKEGTAKFDIEAKSHYDDESIGGYDVNLTETYTGEMVDWVANSSYSYVENGKYYLESLDNKVDYDYSNVETNSVKKGAKIKVPSLKGFTEAAEIE